VDSALSRFLLRRALTKPRLIGHIYYWLLQSEVYNADVSKRYVILLQVSACSYRLASGAVVLRSQYASRLPNEGIVRVY
jgi:hypothetical protein